MCSVTSLPRTLVMPVSSCRRRLPKVIPDAWSSCICNPPRASLRRSFASTLSAMMRMADLETILNAEPEPAFIVGEDGTIEFSTLAASNLNPGLKPGENILAAAKEPDKLKRFLHRCAGYRSRCVGTLILTDGHGKPAPFRVNANRLN